MKLNTPGIPVIFLPGLLILHSGLCQHLDAGYEAYTQYRYACDSPSSCGTNRYSIECPLGQKIVMKGVNYGAKPKTSYCANTMCVNQRRCCQYQNGDCLIPYGDEDLFRVYSSCSRDQQCGWLFASSISLQNKCPLRENSNYVRADFSCVSDNSFLDVCTQHTLTAPSVNLHHSAFLSTQHNLEQCSCLITPDDCNTTANIIFRAVDIRLHDSENISQCSTFSRIELVGQRQNRLYYCEKGKFLHNYELFHTSNENNVVLYLYKMARLYPSKMWLEVRASEPGVNVKVTCGQRSVQTAQRCPPSAARKTSNALDDVESVPERKKNKPTVIKLNPDDVDYRDEGTENEEPSEKKNPAMAAIIGGIAAGVVVLLLLLLVVCLIFRKKRRNKKKNSERDDIGKPCYPYAEESHPVNYYETVCDPIDKSGAVQHGGGTRPIYHQPWGQAEGINVQNRGRQGDLAYATSEEIKVLIEKMEKDRKYISEGEEDIFPVPNPTYYTHISNYSFKPSESDADTDTEIENKEEKESETESVTSENCGTEKLESEDSKVEADRCMDSDVESHRVESETVSQYYDGYESPRVSSLLPSDMSESVRGSERSDCHSDAPKSRDSMLDNVFEDSLSDVNIPSEPAPPLKFAKPKPPGRLKTSEKGDKSSSEDGIKLGNYREPKGSLDGVEATEADAASDHVYSPVYDKLADGQTNV